MNYNVLSTLFVGIDVSSLTNTVCAIDFQNNKLLDFDTKNNRIGAEYIAEAISNCLVSNNFEFVVIALEATSFYSTHIANSLSTNKNLLPPGIGPVISSGIISEIGTIASFRSHDKLAKFAGLTWRKRQSGNYSFFSFTISSKPFLSLLSSITIISILSFLGIESNNLLSNSKIL